MKLNLGSVSNLQFICACTYCWGPRPNILLPVPVSPVYGQSPIALLPSWAILTFRMWGRREASVIGGILVDRCPLARNLP